MILGTGKSKQAQEMITGWVHCGASAFTTSAFATSAFTTSACMM